MFLCDGHPFIRDNWGYGKYLVNKHSIYSTEYVNMIRDVN